MQLAYRDLGADKTVYLLEGDLSLPPVATITINFSWFFVFFWYFRLPFPAVLLGE